MNWFLKLLRWLKDPATVPHEHKFVVLSPAFEPGYFSRWGIEYSECKCGTFQTRLLYENGEEVQDLPPPNEFENEYVPLAERDFDWPVQKARKEPIRLLPNGEFYYERNPTLAQPNRNGRKSKKAKSKTRRSRKPAARH